MVKGFSTFLFFGIAPFLLLSSDRGFAQNLEELDLVLASNSSVQLPTQTQYSKHFEEKTGVKLPALGLIKFYQRFISSQQNNKRVCTFSPSCSRFGAAAIEHCGVFYGVLLTSDRLQRCNGLGRKNYPIDPVTYKFSDPLDSYSFRR